MITYGGQPLVAHALPSGVTGNRQPVSKGLVIVTKDIPHLSGHCVFTFLLNRIEVLSVFHLNGNVVQLSLAKFQTSAG